ncbi:hypothetical protein B0H14DRAFT_1346778 [Mycena olivaceomarginata]|nr:hypothetical protein B0H14DRAFT_1346778 [Mycena olivaceomarginata]
MQLLTFKTRAVYQNTPVSSCQEFAGVCLHDAVIFISIVIFAGGLLLLTLGRHFWAPRQRHDSEEDHAESDPSPPSYSSIGFPPSASHDLALCKGSASPSLDPYHVVAPSFDKLAASQGRVFQPCPVSRADSPAKSATSLFWRRARARLRWRRCAGGPVHSCRCTPTVARIAAPRVCPARCYRKSDALARGLSAVT